MGFWIYQKNGMTYTRKNPVRLTGSGGLLAKHLARFKGEEMPFAWELQVPELVRLVDPSLDAGSHELVFDMMPDAFMEVCLYRVTRIQGTSETDESDFLLACNLLHQGKTAGTAEAEKKSFTLSGAPSQRQIVEAFHLKGGIDGGSFRWARPRMDIGAAICPAMSVPA